MGQVITFYSYKGGTGRTMALANTACLLAKSLPPDEEVLAIDWDLEAPGLHRFFVPPEGDSQREANAHSGVIDLVLELQGLIDNDPSLGKDMDAVADMIAAVDFDRFIVPTRVPNVRLMTAGRFEENYENRVVGFNWPSFYEKAPSALLGLADFLGTRYRYVLIDSRTGLSDLTGVCTMILPEKLVMVFTPSRQSLDGLEGVVRRALAYRRQSPDLRPLGIFPLPSRIELAEPDLRASWRLGDDQGLIGYQPLFESLFRELYEVPECSLQSYFDDVQVQHVPRYAYGEQIAVLMEREPDRLSLSRSYEAFVSRLEHLSVPWESNGRVRPERFPQLQQPDEPELSYQQAADLYSELNDIDGLIRTLPVLAEYKLGRGLKDEVQQIVVTARKLLHHLDKTARVPVLIKLGDLLLPNEPVEALSMYNEALSNANADQRSFVRDISDRQGDAYFMLSQFPNAVQAYDRADVFGSGSKDPPRAIETRVRQAKANIAVGRYDYAARALTEIVERTAASGDEAVMADSLVAIALINLEQGGTAKAEECIDKAAEIYARLRRSSPDLPLARAKLATYAGHFDEAEALIAEAMQGYRKLDDKRGIATALRYTGDIRARRKNSTTS